MKRLIHRPATNLILPWGYLFRASDQPYVAPNWNGIAKESGQHNLTQSNAAQVPGTTFLNGYPCPLFDGVDDYLLGEQVGFGLKDYRYTHYVVFNISAITGTTGYFTTENTIGDVGGYFGHAIYKSGGQNRAQAWHFCPGGNYGVEDTFTLNNWHIAFSWYDGPNNKIFTQIDSKPVVSATPLAPPTYISIIVSALNVAHGYTTSAGYVTGAIAEFGIGAFTANATIAGLVRRDVNNRYNLAL